MPDKMLLFVSSLLVLRVIWMITNPNKKEEQKNNAANNSLPKQGVENTVDKAALTYQVNMFLNSENLTYETRHQGEFFSISFKNEQRFIEMYITVQQQSSFIDFELIIFRDLPDHKILAVSELVARLNEKLTCAKYVIHFESRIVVFATTLVVYDFELTQKMLSLYFKTTWETYVYIPLFEKVINHDEEPFFAIMDYITNDNTA